MSSQKTMKLKLIKKVEEARGTKSFFWEPEKPVSWEPGQYYYFTLPKLSYPDTKGATRHFTIASSPTEGNLLQLTTRIREESGYKKTLDELVIGTEVEGEGPNGTFYLDEKETAPNVYIAGGIGITPFRSMIKYAMDKNLQTPIHLIYSNSDSDFAFGKELKEMDAKNDSVHVEFFDSSASGHLDDTKISKFIRDWGLDIGNCIFWVCGPPAMIDAMEGALAKLKIPSGNIRSEKFTGY